MKLISLNTWGNRSDQSLKFIEDNSSATIFCLQEVLTGGTGKTDQSELKDGFESISKLLPDHIDILEQANGKKIICGDFNLLPGTKSIQMLDDAYRDLIKEYKITSTRSALYTKELRYSDYAFVDKDITVNHFSVPNVTVSDHLPLFLDFD